MAFPLIPVAIVTLGLGLTACVKAASAPKPGATLYHLAGSEWGLKTGGDQFVQFKSDGELTGNGGCNQFFGNYDLNGTELKIGPLAATKKMCRDMGAEQTFMKALQDSRRIEATHLTLVLFDDAGEELLQLQRRDWD